MYSRILFYSTVVGVILLSFTSVHADEPKLDPEQLRFFETAIRPLLADSCYRCHGENRQRGSLRVDNRESLLKGGDTGAAIVPGNAKSSLLLKAVHHDGLEMPPGKKLNAEQIRALEKWVNLGAPWPSNDKKTVVKSNNKGFQITNEDRKFWSFQPVQRSDIPAKGNFSHPVDAFLSVKLQEKGLGFSPPASRRELIRRVYFDLIGLPPSPEEVAAFVADQSPDSYEKLLGKLLAMPQYGERWGRHWLDVVRFAQTSGYERDNEKPHSWRYRDYVIKAFNEDKPYDQFILEHIAGDEIAEVTDDSLTATAFYRLGVWDDEPDDGRQAEFDDLDDILVTTSNAFLGLTVGCARCHDHKFDPIAQEDYYSMLAFIRNVRRFENPGKNATETVFANLKSGGQTLCVHEYGNKARPTHILSRGSAASPEKEVQPQFVRVLCPTNESAQPTIPAPNAKAKTTGRRLVLAKWLANEKHPLTARVMVNRIWQHHFGRGIVATPNDFGNTGTAPTHPQLLDWLASDFMANGWKMKRMHKLIMLSQAYQQSSKVANKKGVAVDPDNTLLWRQNMRRLEAEAIRDTILAVSGNLNLKMGGHGIFPTLPKEVLNTQSRPGAGWQNNTPKEEQHRRSVYIFAKRTLGVPILESFDQASLDTSTARRAVTTIAPQALILLNSRFMDEQANAFAKRLLKEAGKNPEQQIQRMFQLALSRTPSGEEVDIANRFLARMQSRFSSIENPEHRYERSLAMLAKVVLNLNEMIYVD